MHNEEAIERRLQREASEVCLGTLGDRSGINVAKVEVSWVFEYDDFSTEEHAGFYYVHATGNEPECEGEDGTIYAVFENLAHEAMQTRQERLGFADYAIGDISAA